MTETRKIDGDRPYSKLIYHIIFSTKRREPLILAGLCNDLYAYIGGIVRAQKSLLVEIGGMPDHLHLVVRTRPDLSVADLVRLVKANSSKWVNERPDSTGGSRGRKVTGPSA